jgi:histone H3/H4
MDSNNITKPSIQRLCKKAGVKSMSVECVDLIKHLMEFECEELIDNIISYNETSKAKTVMVEDVYKSISDTGYILSKSDNLGQGICSSI